MAFQRYLILMIHVALAIGQEYKYMKYDYWRGLKDELTILKQREFNSLLEECEEFASVLDLMEFERRTRSFDACTNRPPALRECDLSVMRTQQKADPATSKMYGTLLPDEHTMNHFCQGCYGLGIVADVIKCNLETCKTVQGRFVHGEDGRCGCDFDWMTSKDCSCGIYGKLNVTGNNTSTVAKCICHGRWTGDVCDECRGYVNVTENGRECGCPINFFGPDCSSPVCHNGGTLSPDGLKCKCGPIHTGEHCDSLRCANDGIYDPDTDTCECASVYFGPHCSYSPWHPLVAGPCLLAIPFLNICAFMLCRWWIESGRRLLQRLTAPRVLHKQPTTAKQHHFPNTEEYVTAIQRERVGSVPPMNRRSTRRRGTIQRKSRSSNLPELPHSGVGGLHKSSRHQAPVLRKAGSCQSEVSEMTMVSGRRSVQMLLVDQNEMQRAESHGDTLNLDVDQLHKMLEGLESGEHVPEMRTKRGRKKKNVIRQSRRMVPPSSPRGRMSPRTSVTESIAGGDPSSSHMSGIVVERHSKHQTRTSHPIAHGPIHKRLFPTSSAAQDKSKWMIDHMKCSSTTLDRQRRLLKQQMQWNSMPRIASDNRRKSMNPIEVEEVKKRSASNASICSEHELRALARVRLGT